MVSSPRALRACRSSRQPPTDASDWRASILFLRRPFALSEGWPQLTMSERLPTAAELARQVAVGAEDLVVLKMMFYRRKDLADVEAILRDQGRKLDRAAIRQRLSGLVGADDERLRELDAIEHDVDD